MIRLIVFRPDITETVDWALRANYLPTYLGFMLVNRLSGQTIRGQIITTATETERQADRTGRKVCIQADRHANTERKKTAYIK